MKDKRRNMRLGYFGKTIEKLTSLKSYKVRCVMPSRCPPLQWKPNTSRRFRSPRRATDQPARKKYIATRREKCDCPGIAARGRHSRAQGRAAAQCGGHVGNANAVSAVTDDTALTGLAPPSTGLPPFCPLLTAKSSSAPVIAPMIAL